jgi:hypothetical protein
VAGARRNVTLISAAAPLAVGIVMGMASGVAVVERAVVRRAGGLFVRERAFLLLMLLHGISMLPWGAEVWETLHTMNLRFVWSGIAVAFPCSTVQGM